MKTGHLKRRRVSMCLAFLLLVSVNIIQPGFATTGSEIVSNKFTVLIDIVKAFVESVGAIIVLWGLFEWGTALQSNDGTMQAVAFKRIGGGLVMTLGPELLSMFIG